MSEVPLITWSSAVTAQIENLVSPLLQDLRPTNMTGWWLMVRGIIELHDPLTTCSCVLMWHIKSELYPFWQFLWPQNMVTYDKVNAPIKVTCSSDHEFTKDRWQTKNEIFLLPEDVTWQGADIWWAEVRNKVACFSDHMIRRGHVSNKKKLTFSAL